MKSTISDADRADVYGTCDAADVTLGDIQAQKEKLNGYVESNNLALRANVNKNYANFIETAKETANILLTVFCSSQ